MQGPGAAGGEGQRKVRLHHPGSAGLPADLPLHHGPGIALSPAAAIRHPGGTAGLFGRAVRAEPAQAAALRRMQKSFFTAVQNSALRSLSRFQLEKGAIHHETLNSPKSCGPISPSFKRPPSALWASRHSRPRRRKSRRCWPLSRSTTATPI